MKQKGPNAFSFDDEIINLFLVKILLLWLDLPKNTKILHKKIAKNTPCQLFNIALALSIPVPVH